MVLSASKIKAEYDRIAPIFNIGSAVTFPFRRSMYEQFILPQAGLKEGDSVAELCCGAGHNFRYLLSAIGKEGKLTGFDFSEKMQAARTLECIKEVFPQFTYSEHYWGSFYVVIAKASGFS